MSKKSIHIIGGGFSGMCLAFHLAKRNFEVHLHEKQSRLGGLIQTRTNDFGQAEAAANGIMLSDQVVDFFSEINFKPVTTLSEAKRRFIFRATPRQWPLSFWESLVVAKGLFKVLLFGKSSIKPLPGQTIAEWSNSHFSEAFTQFLVGPALQGIYAGDVTKMSATLILGGFFSGVKKPKSKNKGMVSGNKGMQELIDQLASNLEKQGVKIYLNSELTLDQVKGPVVIATSVRAAQRILQKTHPELSLRLQGIEMAPLVSVTTYWKLASSNFKGFGVLLPWAFGFKTLGLLMNSYIYPSRNKFHSETFIMGGPLHPEVIDWSDSQIISQIQSEREKILQTKGELLHHVVTRWQDGLPQYNLSLEKVLSDLPLPRHLYLHGNYLGQIGLTKILARTVELAEEIASKEIDG